MVNWLVAISFQCFQRDQRYSTAVYQSWVAGERFRPRLHYAGRIRKRSFIFTVKANVHNNPPRLKTELFENPLQTRWIWKHRLFVLINVDWEHFENRPFGKTMTSRWSGNFADRIFLKHKSKMIRVCCVLKFSGVMWTENIWCVFQSEIAVFKFLRIMCTGRNKSQFYG